MTPRTAAISGALVAAAITSLIFQILQPTGAEPDHLLASTIGETLAQQHPEGAINPFSSGEPKITTLSYSERVRRAELEAALRASEELQRRIDDMAPVHAVGQRVVEKTRPQLGLTKLETAELLAWYEDANEVTRDFGNGVAIDECMASLATWSTQTGDQLRPMLAKKLGDVRHKTLLNKLEELKDQYPDNVQFAREEPLGRKLWALLVYQR